ncbi:MAG TPA: DUF2891 domain-containing protein [Gemmatimonadaceae bacterium]|nr:DUF2891 domain-containing protein [Gemmatimonadaceae bacterium]
MSDLLSPAMASRFATIAIGHVEREYPNKLDHVLNGPADLRGPRDLHPIFHGSFDWHSCVHGYWLLATVERRFPKLEVSARIRELFERQFTPDKVGAELAYLNQPMRAGFERPYGWAWLLMLAAEFHRGGEHSLRWSQALAPLAFAFTERFRTFLPKATYPIRSGAHFNTAFALTLAIEYADTVDDLPFARMLREQALGWYSGDRDAQAWEPGGDDFLSPTLIEAECMRNVISASDYAIWLDRFLPRLLVKQPASLFEPATVSDRSDGKIAHLDGLNLSRAWCWRSIAATIPASDARRQIALDAARTHLHASLPQVAGDYMGEHWLATFALLAVR